jgi:hypothetical protein
MLPWLCYCEGQRSGWGYILANFLYVSPIHEINACPLLLHTRPFSILEIMYFYHICSITLIIVDLDFTYCFLILHKGTFFYINLQFAIFDFVLYSIFRCDSFLSGPLSDQERHLFL